MSGERGTLRALSAVAMAILPIGALFAAYLFVYVSGKRDYLTQRDFRTLGTMSRQLSERLAHIRQTAEECLDSGLDACLADRLGQNVERPRRAEPTEPGPCTDGEVEWRALPDTRVYDLSVRYNTSTGRTPALRVSFKRIIEAQLGAGVFDDIVVADSAGRIFYQHREFDTGTLPDLQTLLRAEAGDEPHEGEAKKKAAKKEAAEKEEKEGAAEAAAKSAVSDLDVPFSKPKEVAYLGQGYLAFFQPVPVGATASEGDGGTDHLLLCGLVKASDFEASTREISPILLSLLSLLVLLALLAWQLLKLWYLGRRERLDGLDVILLVLSSIAVSGIITAALLDLYAYRGINERRDGEMTALAREIERNFRSELRALYLELDHFRAAIEPEAARLAGQSNAVPDAAAVARVGAAFGKGKGYPYFSDLVWVAPSGAIRARWGPRYMTDGTLDGLKEPEHPAFLVDERRYFADVRGSRLWQVRPDGQGEPMRFAIEVLQSKLTGRVTVVVAASVRGEPKGEMAVVGARILSTIDATLPPGYEFAIINQDGRVQLHSDEGRDLQENLFQECDGSRALRAAIESRQAILLDAPYYGEDHRLYTLPLADTPWSLVILYKNDLLHGANAWIGLAWLVAFAVYVGCLLFAAIVVQMLRPGYRAEWLWPDRRQTGAYALAAVVLLAAGGSCFVASRRGDEVCELLSIACAPPIGVGALYLILAGRGGAFGRIAYLGAGLLAVAGLAMLTHATGPAQTVLLSLAVAAAIAVAARFRGWAPAREGIFRIAYSTMLAALLLLLGVGPAVALFRSAFDQAMIAVTRVGHRQMLDALVSRASRVRDQALAQRIDLPWKARLDHSLDVYCSGLCASAPPDASRAGPGEGGGASQSTYLAGSLSALMPAPNRAIERIRQAVANEASDHAWRWSDLPPRRVVLAIDNPSLRAAIGDRFSLGSAVPTLSFARPADLGLGALFAVVWLGLILGAIYYVTRNLFLLDADRPDRSGLPAPGQNRWVFVNTARETPKNLQIHAVDLRTLDAPSQCERLLNEYRLLSSGAVILDHFETRLDRAEWNAAKLALVEKLAARGDSAVIVMSDVDPLAYWSQSAADGDAKTAPACMSTADLTRWSEVLATFDEFCVARSEEVDHGATELLGSGVTGLLAARGGLDSAARCTSAEYRAVWALCTKAEKLVLIQLASEGYANPKNANVVGGLMRRGLIVRDPALGFRSEDFRQFVRGVESPDTIAAWEGEGGRSGWAKLRPVLLGVVTLGVGFFYITQRGLFDSTLATAGAVAGALPILLRLLGTLGEERGGGQQRS